MVDGPDLGSVDAPAGFVEAIKAKLQDIYSQLAPAALAEAVVDLLPTTRILEIPFTFDSPGLLTGEFEAYTPKVGETVLNASFEVLEAWNGPSARADVGQFKNGDSQGFIGGVNLGVVPAGPESGGVQPISSPSSLVQAYWGAGMYRVRQAYPICLCVSSDGTPAGDDPEATQGAAILHLEIAVGEAPFSVPEGTVAQLGAQIAAELSAVRAIVTAMLADATAQQRLSARYAEVGSARVSKTGDEVIELLSAKPYGRYIRNYLIGVSEAFADNTGTQPNFTVGVVGDESAIITTGSFADVPAPYGGTGEPSYGGGGTTRLNKTGYLSPNTALNIYKIGAVGDGTGEFDIVVQAVSVL